MEKFIIGGKEYDAIVTYRIRRFFSENCKKEILEKLSFEQSEDMVLDAILMSLVNKDAFKKRDELMDVLTNDEFNVFNKRFGEILNPEVEGKTEIEKKPEQMTASSSTS